MTMGYPDVSGCRIRFSVDGAGPVPLPLVHGAGAHRMWWPRMVPALARTTWSRPSTSAATATANAAPRTGRACTDVRSTPPPPPWDRAR